MKHKSILNAINKLGLKIQVNDNGQHWVDHNGRTLSWYVQGESAICVHMCRSNEGSDIYTDYFPGSFTRTLKVAINYIRGE